MEILCNNLDSISRTGSTFLWSLSANIVHCNKKHETENPAYFLVSTNLVQFLRFPFCHGFEPSIEISPNALLVKCLRDEFKQWSEVNCDEHESILVLTCGIDRYGLGSTVLCNFIDKIYPFISPKALAKCGCTIGLAHSAFSRLQSGLWSGREMSLRA